MVSFTTLALLATSAVAGPVARGIPIPEGFHFDSPIPKDLRFDVLEFGAGCDRNGCYYFFNVTVPSVENGPAGVKASCIIYEDGYANSFTIPTTYKGCSLYEGVNNSVAARPSLRNHTSDFVYPTRIEVSFLYAGDGDQRPSYNYSGSHEITYNQFTAPTYNFTIIPTDGFAVAT